MALKASADDTETAFSLLEAEEPPNFGPPMHIHHDAAEAFYVVSGEYRIFIEGEAAIDGSEMDDETLGEIARRYGMEVIGPVPEGYV
jgi:hypothetical protein